MKLSATVTEANTNNPTVKLVSLGREPSEASAKMFWQSLAARFWGHTEEMGKTDTKPFEGLL